MQEVQCGNGRLEGAKLGHVSNCTTRLCLEDASSSQYGLHTVRFIQASVSHIVCGIYMKKSFTMVRVPAAKRTRLRCLQYTSNSREIHKLSYVYAQKSRFSQYKRTSGATVTANPIDRHRPLQNAGSDPRYHILQTANQGVSSHHLARSFT